MIECDVTQSLIALLERIRQGVGEKTFVLESGTYRISSSLLEKHKMYITNSMAAHEWKRGEVPHEIASAIYLEGVDDLTIEGNGALFLIDGQVVNLTARHCKNLTVKNIAFDSVCPDMHFFRVAEQGAYFIDFELFSDSSYTKKNGQFYFTGPDYQTAFFHRRKISFHNGWLPASDSDAVIRRQSPFAFALALKELRKNVFRAYYLKKPKVDKGDSFCLFDVRRKHAGIFIEDCENVVLEGIEQRFNYGLAAVFQCSKNVTLKNSRFAPDKESGRRMASVADFMQVCMCRGLIIVENCYFEGSGDDGINVHGVHYKIVKQDGNKLTVRFMHNQTLGYNAFLAGDKITFVDPRTLLCLGEAKVQSAELLDAYEILLVLDNAPQGIKGLCVEDTDACPDLIYKGNTLNRIITRGMLLTTRGKCVVSGNTFQNTSMSAIVISDDAKNWYESGYVCDVLIEDNDFLTCEGKTVEIRPENSVHQGYVHSGIMVRGNRIRTPEFFVKSSEKVLIEDNICAIKPKLETINSEVEYKNNFYNIVK